MSINLDLDFKDYAPQHTEETSRTLSAQQQSEVVIKIPENQSKQKIPLSGRNPIGDILKNATNFGARLGMSDEDLRQLIWVSERQRLQQQRGGTGGNWGLNFFAQYFDVTTNDVLERILWSAVPVRKTGIDIDSLNDSELIAPLATSSSTASSVMESDRVESSARKQRAYSYIERFIQSRPDFYGPFWISTTLIFAVAIFSNIVSFLNFRSRIEKKAVDIGSSINESIEVTSDKIDQNMDGWHYSMDELNMATSIVIVYVLLLPTFLWLLFWFRGCTKYYKLSETICAFGYSLSIFVPLSALFMVQVILIRYFALTLASLLSGVVLALSFIPIVKSDPNPASSHFILAMILACQFGTAYILHRIMLQ